jgi:hypothetical protein
VELCRYEWRRTLFHTFGEKILLLLLLLELDPVLALEPALGRSEVILVLVVAESLHELADTADPACDAVLRRLVARLDVAQGRAGREKRKEVVRELVRHRVAR